MRDYLITAKLFNDDIQNKNIVYTSVYLCFIRNTSFNTKNLHLFDQFYGEELSHPSD